ncbi:hypothetical protein ABK040_016721 [Willaertia magna]
MSSSIPIRNNSPSSGPLAITSSSFNERNNVLMINNNQNSYQQPSNILNYNQQQQSNSLPHDFTIESSMNNKLTRSNTIKQLNENINNTFNNNLCSTMEVFVTDPPIINQFMYHKWLEGYSIEETSKYLFEKQRKVNNEYFKKYSNFLNSYYQLIINEVNYQFRIFNDVQPYLNNPSLFMSCETTLQMAPSVKRLLIQQFFDFDERVIRELMGKKLTTKSRRDLDDISEKYNLEIISVRRQFDNLKIISKFFKSIDQSALTDFTGISNVNENTFDTLMIMTRIVQNSFYLPERLAEKYVTVVFMGDQRFETSKRVMKDFNFQDLFFFSSRILKHWTLQARLLEELESSTSIKATSENTQLGTSPTFIAFNTHKTNDEPITVLDIQQISLNFVKFRDIKSILFSDRSKLKEFQSIVMKQLANDKAFVENDLRERIDDSLPSIIKSLLQIAQGLITQKEMRDVFIDIYEKFVEPILKLKLTNHQLFQILEAIRESFELTSSIKPHYIQKYKYTFSQFMIVLRDISVYMHKKSIN